MKQTYIQFTAGRGPVECAAACFSIVRGFMNYLNSNKIKYEVVDVEEDDEYGYRSVIIKLIDVYNETVSKLKSEWEGTIKFISLKNSFRPHHKRKNWYVGCNFFEIDNDKITFDMNDVKVDYMRSSGPGGQNVNKVESAIRLTHIPTGISVKCDGSRDRIQNFKTAKEILQAKLNALNNMNELDRKNAFWLSHDNLERGNEIMIIRGKI